MDILTKILIIILLAFLLFIALSIISALSFDRFKRVLVPKYIHICKKEIDIIHREIKYTQCETIDTVCVKCNPILNFFGLLRFDKNRHKFEPIHLWFGDEEAINILKQ